jgi:hypothetical protein
VFVAIFKDHHLYLALLTAAAVVLGSAAWWVAARQGSRRGSWWFLLVGCVTGMLGVVFMGASVSPSGSCVVNHDVAEGFRGIQGVWNLAMVIPVGLFAVLASRRVWVPSVAVVGLPLAVEFAQATVPGLGRICDSTDALMNVLGGVAGVAAGVAVLAARREVDWKAGLRNAGIGAGALAVCGMLAGSLVSFRHVDGTGLAPAQTEQRRYVEKAVTEAFGDRYRVSHVYEQPCLDAVCKNLVFTLLSPQKGNHQDFANGRLSWPDRGRFNVLLVASTQPSTMGFPVDGTKAPKTEAEAYAVARAYAAGRYPWGEGATNHKTYPVGKDAELGWMTSWRWTHEGVLMPRMLDVQVGRDGRISQVDVSQGPARLDLPELKVSKEEAAERVRARFREQVGDQPLPEGLKIEPFTVKAVKTDAGWRPVWLVHMATSETAEVRRVDGISGQLLAPDEATSH